MTENTFILSSSDPSTQEALRTGWYREGAIAEPKRIIARKLLGDESALEKLVLFEWIKKNPNKPSGVLPWLKMIRAFSLTATGTPCLAILILRFYSTGGFQAAYAVCALLGVLFLQIAINVFNDIEDYRRLIDLPGTLGGSGVIQSGWWTPAQLKRVAWTALTLGTVLGAPAVFINPGIILPIGALAVFGVLFYSGRKAGLKYAALGDLAVWILCGPALTLGYSVTLYEGFNFGVLWVGSFFGFLAAGLLHINNVQDMKHDFNQGVTTLALVLGFKNSLRFLTFLYVAAGFSIFVPVLLGQLPVYALGGAIVTALVSAPWLRVVNTALGPESASLSNCRMKAAQIHLLGGLSLSASLALGLVIRHFLR